MSNSTNNLLNTRKITILNKLIDLIDLKNNLKFKLKFLKQDLNFYSPNLHENWVSVSFKFFRI